MGIRVITQSSSGRCRRQGPGEESVEREDREEEGEEKDQRRLCLLLSAEPEAEDGSNTVRAPQERTGWGGGVTCFFLGHCSM